MEDNYGKMLESVERVFERAEESVSRFGDAVFNSEDYDEDSELLSEEDILFIENEIKPWSDEVRVNMLTESVTKGRYIPGIVIGMVASQCPKLCAEAVSKYIDDSVVELDWNTYVSDEENERIELFSRALAVYVKCNTSEVYDRCREIFYKVRPSNERIVELLAVAIAKGGSAVISSILVDSDVDFEKKHTLLYSVISCGTQSDDVYKAVRTWFRGAADIEQRVYIADGLGRYGDPRAIPMLRKLAIEVKELHSEPTQDSEAKRMLFNYMVIITGAIESLGGDSSDIAQFGE